MSEVVAKNNHEMAALIAKMDEVVTKLAQLGKEKEILKERWLTVEEVCKLLAISSRLLQNYRDEGLIAFSQYGHKIYFKAADIESFLLQNYREAFKIEKK